MTDLARSGSAPLTGPLAGLAARTIHDGLDRQGWLEARQGRVTATMARDLVRGGAAARRRIIAESFVPPVEIVGNRYIDRGHEREPHIAAWVQRRWPDLHPNVALYAAAENDRWAATPDGIGIDRGEIALVEIKTSKFDLDPDDPESSFEAKGYYEQMQWQMLVTGAAWTLFVWEQHDDGWPNPVPISLEPETQWIERHEPTIERMIAAADSMLAERDRIVAERLSGRTGDEPENVEVDALAIAVLDAREAAKLAKARLDAPWNRLHALLAGTETFSQRTGLAQVTWNERTTRVETVDEDAALAGLVTDDPDSDLAGVTGADLYADLRLAEAKLTRSEEAEVLAAAQAAWDEHRKRYSSTTTSTKASLTVTAPKAAKR